MNPVDRLNAEIEELDKHLNPTLVDTQVKAEEAEKIDATVVDPAVDTQKANEIVEGTERDKYKKMYEESTRRTAGLKASTDSFKFQTRQQLKELKDQILYWKDKAAAAPEVDIFDSVVTDADKDTIGTEAVDVIKRLTSKASEAQVNPLKLEIERLNKEKESTRKNKEEQESKDSSDKFLTSLEGLVSNWREIDINPEFLIYMDNVDEYSGYPRSTLFKRAYTANDVGRVAGFMKDFVKSQKPEVTLEEMVGPTGSSTVASPAHKQEGEVIPISFVEEFENAVIKGHYKQKSNEANKIQTKIDLAFKEGRINFKL